MLVTAATWMAAGLLAAIGFLALFGQRISDHINRGNHR